MVIWIVFGDMGCFWWFWWYGLFFFFLCCISLLILLSIIWLLLLLLSLFFDEVWLRSDEILIFCWLLLLLLFWFGFCWFLDEWDRRIRWDLIGLIFICFVMWSVGMNSSSFELLSISSLWLIDIFNIYLLNNIIIVRIIIWGWMNWF